jgi:hypothetical protein
MPLKLSSRPFRLTPGLPEQGVGCASAGRSPWKVGAQHQRRLCVRRVQFPAIHPHFADAETLGGCFVSLTAVRDLAPIEPELQRPRR